jgi:hypothetical protein
MLVRGKYHGFILAFALSAGTVVAQEKPDNPIPKTDGTERSAQQPEAQNPQTPGTNPNAPPDENPKRILGIIPNFQTTNDVPKRAEQPLSVKEKYILAYHQTADFSAHLGNLFQAALQQASNGQPHYGQGWGAYGQRFGAAEADQVTSSFFIFGLIPHVLKQDPRYFRKARGSAWSRISYAATRTVIGRTDAGDPTFNYPQVLGQLAQQGISTTYYPQQDRSTAGVFQNWSVNLAYNSAYNVLKEYYPDMLRLVFHRHRKEQADAVPSASQPSTNTTPAEPSKP